MGAVRVMLATRPVDFRKGMDGLAALVSEAMGADLQLLATPGGGLTARVLLPAGATS